MNISFVTFADSRYRPTLERIKQEAEGMDIFKNIYILTEKDFDDNYRKFFYGQQRDKMFAFGFYCWKSWAVNHAIHLIYDNDYLVYCDAGCVLNKKYASKLLDWLKEISNDNDIIAFQQTNYLEYLYCKEDLFRYFSISNNDIDIRQTGQFFAGVLIIRKTKSSFDLVDKWYQTSNSDINLIDDSVIEPNPSDFVAHRYDQSILSLLLKLYPKKCVKDVITIRDKNNARISPIAVSRKKKRTIMYNIKLFPLILINKICWHLGIKMPFSLRN